MHIALGNLCLPFLRPANHIKVGVIRQRSPFSAEIQHYFPFEIQKKALTWLYSVKLAENWHSLLRATVTLYKFSKTRCESLLMPCKRLKDISHTKYMVMSGRFRGAMQHADTPLLSSMVALWTRCYHACLCMEGAQWYSFRIHWHTQKLFSVCASALLDKPPHLLLFLQKRQFFLPVHPNPFSHACFSFSSVLCSLQKPTALITAFFVSFLERFFMTKMLLDKNNHKHKVSTKIHKCHIKQLQHPQKSWCPVTHLRGRGSGQCVRGLLAVGGGSLLLLSDWLLCTCLSTLLFRSSSVVMIFHCRNRQQRATLRLLTDSISESESKYVEFQPWDHVFQYQLFLEIQSGILLV